MSFFNQPAQPAQPAQWNRSCLYSIGVKCLTNEISVAPISSGRALGIARLFNRDEISVALISSGWLIKKISQLYSQIKI
jgi:hypothetical protein